MTTYHEAGAMDPVSCEVRCVRCGLVLAPAHVWRSEVWTWDQTARMERFTGHREHRQPMAIRPAAGSVVAMQGQGPFYGRFTVAQGQQATCKAVARVA